MASAAHHLCNLAGDHVPAEDRLRPPRPAVGHGEQHLIVPWPPLDVRDVLPGTQGRRTSDLPDGTGRGSYGKFHIWLLTRSEEHTSELQSLLRLSYAVFCLKKKTHTNTTPKQ